MDDSRKKIIGLVELIRVIGKKKSVLKKALVDTGATRTCVDMKLAGRVGLGPVVSSVRIKNKRGHAGYDRRPVVKGIVEIQGLRIPLEMSLEDRSHMAYKVLLGRDALFGKFIVDVSRTHSSNKIKDTN
ncbi:Putative ATP-dependant zinc protease [uncultured archaeon]|nr:Putative ATP-dependant zinc protease [uncultured archaeon]